jgi:hypothetical protein
MADAPSLTVAGAAPVSHRVPLTNMNAITLTNVIAAVNLPERGNAHRRRL